MKILFTGSRRLADDTIIRIALSELKAVDFSLFVHGDGSGLEAPGCDQLVDKLADELGVAKKKYPAPWRTMGKSAGPARNTTMVQYGADICLAFPCPKSVGTWDCLRKAAAAGIPVRIYPVKP